MNSDTIEHTYVYIKNHYIKDERGVTKTDVEVTSLEIRKIEGEYIALFSNGERFKLLPLKKNTMVARRGG